MEKIDLKSNELNEKTIWIYNKVEEMIDDNQNFKNEDIVKTLGYYAPGDGGGAYYRIIEDDLSSDGSFVIELQSNLFAVLLIEKNVVDIRQLGARCYDGTKYDIKQYLMKYMDKLNEVKEKRLKLYIPSGIWHLSDYTITNLQGFDIFGDYSFQSYTCNGTIIAPMNNNQSYVLSIGNEENSVANFSLLNICFTTSNIIINQNGRYSLTDSNINQVTNVLRLINASFGKLNNIMFNNIKGCSLNIKNTWEVVFGYIGIHSCSNISSGSIVFDTKDTTINDNANISNLFFNNIMIEGTEGNIIELKPKNNLIDTIFNNISWEPKIYTQNNGVINHIPNNNYNDNIATKWALFNIQGEMGCIINNISLNNIAYQYETINSNQYIYDTIFKIDSNTNQAVPNITLNNIQVTGMPKSVNLILQESDKTVNRTSSFILNNVRNSSYYNFLLNISNFPVIINNAKLGSLFNGCINSINNHFNSFSKCVKLTDSPLSHFYFKYDNNAISIDKIVISPDYNSTAAFAFTTLYGKKLNIRAKVENGKTYKLTVTNPSYSHLKIFDLVGTGSYKTYQLDISDIATYFVDNPIVYFASNSQNKTAVDVSLDYFYFE